MDADFPPVVVYPLVVESAQHDPVAEIAALALTACRCREVGAMLADMGQPDEATEVAIERMKRILPSRAPSLWAALRDPASEREIEALRSALAPWVLPSAIESWLRFSDGSAIAFPIVESRFLRASEIPVFYEETLTVISPGLLPISYESHFQASIAMDPYGPHVIVDTDLESVERRLIAPSLAGVLVAIADLAEEGLLVNGDPPANLDWPDSAEALQWTQDFETSREAAIRRLDWSDSPFPPYEWFSRDEAPPAWGPDPLGRTRN